MNEQKIKYRSAADMLILLLIVFFLLIQLYPIIWVFTASFKTSAELSSRPFSFSGQLTLRNYARIFEQGRIFFYMWNSIKVTFVALLLIMLFSSTAGYALSKFRSRSARVIYAFFTVGIMIPVQITLIPLFIFYSRMHILNTTFALVLPQVGFALPLSIMMFVNFYMFVPDDLLESATIDGCTPYSIFTRILLPPFKEYVRNDSFDVQYSDLERLYIFQYIHQQKFCKDGCYGTEGLRRCIRECRLGAYLCCNFCFNFTAAYRLFCIEQTGNRRYDARGGKGVEL
jgi:ABC-type maltose transport system permease subunit